jgi:hypothetical protein
LAKTSGNTDKNIFIGELQWHLLTEYFITMTFNIYWQRFFVSVYRGNYSWKWRNEKKWRVIITNSITYEINLSLISIGESIGSFLVITWKSTPFSLSLIFFLLLSFFWKKKESKRSLATRSVYVILKKKEAENFLQLAGLVISIKKSVVLCINYVIR